MINSRLKIIIRNDDERPRDRIIIIITITSCNLLWLRFFSRSEQVIKGCDSFWIIFVIQVQYSQQCSGCDNYEWFAGEFVTSFATGHRGWLFFDENRIILRKRCTTKRQFFFLKHQYAVFKYTYLYIFWLFFPPSRAGKISVINLDFQRSEKYL